ncbi:uncharacterized protein CDAR_378601 [Caerostris darwini]|uniref:Uncharacterized protein n=1 Tax=Caerostris darwini TaxID=1538125 RepID=A0AAV4RUR6_9ARAC|nr:uncharacterized protein CDAR_378601 [Caerostris darwini]
MVCAVDEFSFTSNLPVTLYQHTYIHLNEYSKNILDSDLEELENFVLDFLHSCSSNLVSLLISDIWMHRLRCSSVENLLSRCSSFSCKLLKMPSNRIAILVLKRMVKFLPPNHKKRLFSQITELKSFLYEEHKVLHRFGTPQSYNNTLHKEKNTCPDVGLLLKELKKEDFENHQQLIEKVCCILEFCTASINVLEICEFLRLIEFSTVMFKSEIYEIQVAVLTFLRALNFKKFNDKDPQFVNVRSSLASLFNTALRSKNYIIRLEALSIFCVMAQFTDIRITQETIARFPDLYPEVKAYMSQIPQSGFLTNKDKIEKMEKQLCNTEDEPELSITLSEQSKSVLSLLLPS